MKKNTRNNNEIKKLNITKYPYLLTSYNRKYDRNNKSYNNTHNKLKININKTFSLYNPDEEYVTKLNFFNIGTTRRDAKKKVTLYNLNTVPLFPSILKKDSDNAESFKEKKRILNQLNSKMIVYDKENNGEGSKQTYVNRYENSVKENKLEKDRKDIEKKIYKLKEMIKTLSNELSMTLKEIESLKLDVDIMQNYRSYSLFGSITQRKNDTKNKETNNENEKEANQNSQSKKRKSIMRERNSLTGDKDKSKEKENKFRLEMKLIAKSEKVNKLKEETKVKIKKLEEKKCVLIEKIDTCENELKRFKEIHHNLKDELLVHYHRLLLEGKDTRKEGLSWIILAIWNLKSNVLLSYMPKFLDQNIILFLFEYSSLIKKIKETEKNIHELAVQLKEHKENLKNKSRKEDLQNIVFNNNKGKFQNVSIDSKSSESEEEDDNSEDKEDKEEENSSDKEKEESKNENDSNDLNNELIKEEDIENENEEISVNKINKNISKLNEENESKKENNELNEKEVENKEENKGDDAENDEYDLMKEEKKYNNKQQTKFEETFKTSLYNTNSENMENKNSDNILFEKENFKKSKENNFLENKEFKVKKEKNQTINLPANFIKSLFRKEHLYKNKRNDEDKEVKIKLCDFKNIYNRRQSYAVDIRTFQLFNEHKNMEKYYLKLKEKADLLMKNELDIVNKSFYLYDYGGRYNIDQKTVISALIGEDSVRAEYNKQKKEEKEYFKTLKELRNGKISQNN